MPSRPSPRSAGPAGPGRGPAASRPLLNPRPASRGRAIQEAEPRATYGIRSSGPSPIRRPRRSTSGGIAVPLPRPCPVRPHHPEAVPHQPRGRIMVANLRSTARPDPCALAAVSVARLPNMHPAHAVPHPHHRPPRRPRTTMRHNRARTNLDATPTTSSPPTSPAAPEHAVLPMSARSSKTRIRGLPQPLTT
jgi:hypothetical protein